MKTNIFVETHIYEENRLRDEMLNEELGNDIDSCGIISPEIIIPIRKNRNPIIMFEYTEKTTIENVVSAIYNEFGFLELDELFRPEVAFLHNGIRYWVDDKDANFQTVANKYLDPEKSGNIFVSMYVCGDAGCVCEDDGVRYYMNSRERGKHNEPHIHLHSINSCEEAVIIIRTRKIIGKFPRKLIKKVVKKVEKEERFFLEQWNVLTDGLSVDLNRYFGVIDY